MLLDVVEWGDNKCSGRPILVLFIKENWIWSDMVYLNVTCLGFVFVLVLFVHKVKGQEKLWM